MTLPQPPVPPGTPESFVPAGTSPISGPATWQGRQTAEPQPPAPKRGNKLTSKPAIGVAALIVGLILGASSAGGAKTATGSAQPAPTVTIRATQTATVEAGAQATDDATAEPSEEPTPTETEAPAPAKNSYKALSSRKFKLLAKDPDSYIGKTYVVYGEITQFDAATGTDSFRADTGAKKLRISYGYVSYPRNALFNGTESKLKKLVEGDCFKAKVTVLGSFSYDTQAGGNTTVPLFQVDSISVYGSTD